jgi:hypothetical protein
VYFKCTCFELCYFYFWKAKKRKTCTVGTQTEEKDVHLEATPSWSNKEEEEKQSLAEQVKEAAQNAMQLTGFVYEETSGMYYDYNTGYYYSAVSMIR